MDAATTNGYVGTLVGESTSREFRIAVAHETIREQDIIAVDATLRRPTTPDAPERIRIWAKVQRIERINPLFPTEAGHELAATQTHPLETVLSLSREMVTAVCQVLGAEPLDGTTHGRLDHLRYPAQPASTAYSPSENDLARVVLGDLRQTKDRALDIATLANRPSVNVLVDGHAIVTRHLAILAMTGAGKSWAARRVIEELVKKNWPIVIFDPRGDYSGLGDVPELTRRVRRYYAQFPIFEQDIETVITIIQSLGWKLANTHSSLFEELFKSAHRFLSGSTTELRERTTWLSDHLGSERIAKFGVQPDLYFLANFVQAVVEVGKTESEEDFRQLREWGTSDELKIKKGTARNLEGLPGNIRTAARQLRQMEEISKKVAHTSEPLPLSRTDLVAYGQISVIALSGYRSDFQAIIYRIITEAIFTARLRDELEWPVLFLLEEAHNFAPAKANTPAEEHAAATTRQIAQEGRKFGVGLVLISQRPSRLDETTLSQCNSYIIMRMANPVDQNYVRRVIETLGEDEAAMLPDLDVGEAILSGQLTNFPVLVRIKPPESKGEHEEEDAFIALEQTRANSIGPRT